MGQGAKGNQHRLGSAAGDAGGVGGVLVNCHGSFIKDTKRQPEEVKSEARNPKFETMSNDQNSK